MMTSRQQSFRFSSRNKKREGAAAAVDPKKDIHDGWRTKRKEDGRKAQVNVSDQIHVDNVNTKNIAHSGDRFKAKKHQPSQSYSKTRSDVKGEDARADCWRSKSGQRVEIVNFSVERKNLLRIIDAFYGIISEIENDDDSSSSSSGENGDWGVESANDQSFSECNKSCRETSKLFEQLSQVCIPFKHSSNWGKEVSMAIKVVLKFNRRRLLPHNYACLSRFVTRSSLEKQLTISADMSRDLYSLLFDYIASSGQVCEFQDSFYPLSVGTKGLAQQGVLHEIIRAFAQVIADCGQHFQDKAKSSIVLLLPYCDHRSIDLDARLSAIDALGNLVSVLKIDSFSPTLNHKDAEIAGQLHVKANENIQLALTDAFESIVKNFESCFPSNVEDGLSVSTLRTLNIMLECFLDISQKESSAIVKSSPAICFARSVSETILDGILAMFNQIIFKDGIACKSDKVFDQYSRQLLYSMKFISSLFLLQSADKPWLQWFDLLRVPHSSDNKESADSTKTISLFNLLQLTAEAKGSSSGTDIRNVKETTLKAASSVLRNMNINNQRLLIQNAADSSAMQAIVRSSQLSRQVAVYVSAMARRCFQSEVLFNLCLDLLEACICSFEILCDACVSLSCTIVESSAIPEQEEVMHCFRRLISLVMCWSLKLDMSDSVDSQSSHYIITAAPLQLDREENNYWVIGCFQFLTRLLNKDGFNEALREGLMNLLTKKSIVQVNAISKVDLLKQLTQGDVCSAAKTVGEVGEASYLSLLLDACAVLASISSTTVNDLHERLSMSLHSTVSALSKLDPRHLLIDYQRLTEVLNVFFLSPSKTNRLFFICLAKEVLCLASSAKLPNTGATLTDEFASSLLKRLFLSCNDADHQVRTAALTSLARCHDASLLHLASSTGDLSRQHSDDFLALLARMCSDHVSTVRVEACRALGEAVEHGLLSHVQASPLDALSQVEMAIVDTKLSVRIHAVQAFSHILRRILRERFSYVCTDLRNGGEVILLPRLAVLNTIKLEPGSEKHCIYSDALWKKWYIAVRSIVEVDSDKMISSALRLLSFLCCGAGGTSRTVWILGDVASCLLQLVFRHEEMLPAAPAVVEVDGEKVVTFPLLPVEWKLTALLEALSTNRVRWVKILEAVCQLAGVLLWKVEMELCVTGGGYSNIEVLSYARDVGRYVLFNLMKLREISDVSECAVKVLTIGLASYDCGIVWDEHYSSKQFLSPDVSSSLDSRDLKLLVLCLKSTLSYFCWISKEEPLVRSPLQAAENHAHQTDAYWKKCCCFSQKHSSNDNGGLTNNNCDSSASSGAGDSGSGSGCSSSGGSDSQSINSVNGKLSQLLLLHMILRRLRQLFVLEKTDDCVTESMEWERLTTVLFHTLPGLLVSLSSAFSVCCEVLIYLDDYYRHEALLGVSLGSWRRASVSAVSDPLCHFYGEGGKVLLARRLAVDVLEMMLDHFAFSGQLDLLSCAKLGSSFVCDWFGAGNISLLTAIKRLLRKLESPHRQVTEEAMPAAMQSRGAASEEEI